MLMHVSFPKDKEEMKRKRMEALMKKIEANGGQQQQDVDFYGRDGERRMEQITNDLKQYYKNNTGAKESPKRGKNQKSKSSSPEERIRN